MNYIAFIIIYFSIHCICVLTGVNQLSISIVTLSKHFRYLLLVLSYLCDLDLHYWCNLICAIRYAITLMLFYLYELVRIINVILSVQFRYILYKLGTYIIEKFCLIEFTYYLQTKLHYFLLYFNYLFYLNKWLLLYLSNISSLNLNMIAIWNEPW